MNDYSTPSHIDEPQLMINSEIKVYLLEISKWAKFLAILGLIGVSLMIIISLSISIFMGDITQDFGDVGIPAFGIFGALLYSLLAAIMAIPMIYLYRFSTHIKDALNNDNSLALSLAFRNLKSHYKFYGILTIILIVFYAILFFIFITSFIFAST